MAEEKVRFQIRIDPDTDRKVKAAMPLANCRSQNEFVETALRFYCDYLTASDCTAVAPNVPVCYSRYGAGLGELRLPTALQAGSGAGHGDECAGGGDGDSR